VDETKLAGLELAPSDIVDVPRIAGSPVAMECKVFQLVETGGTGVIVIAKIVRLHVRTSVFKDLQKLYVDPEQMRLIARMHGPGTYCTTRDTFVMDRKNWPIET
jgi:flavin reductase (DIM6/NTAB) family NADH-FMN oxidoreductase RutF